VTAVLCAVTMTTLVGYEWFQGRTSRSPPQKNPIPIANWQGLSGSGHREGPADAVVTIVTFADFECPFCKKFALQTLPAIQTEFPGEVAVIMRHWPLDYHRFARPAARASECAAAQGRFKEMHDLLYAKQDSLGLKPFSGYAREAGVSDSIAFEGCIQDTREVLTIEQDRKAALDGRFTGTPTVIVNGLLFPGVPDSTALATHVRGIIAEKARTQNEK
jgi:protein-disulfide isomerase